MKKFSRIDDVNSQSHILMRIPVEIYCIQLTALIDNGASVSAVSNHALEKLATKIYLSIRTDCMNNYYCASGKQMASLGIVPLSFSFGSNQPLLEGNFHIFKEITEDCILGTDFLSKHQVHLRYGYGVRVMQYLWDGRLYVKEYLVDGMSWPTRSITQVEQTINIAENALTERQKLVIASIIEKNSNIFAKSNHELGVCLTLEHTIQLTNSPRYRHPYRVPRQLESFVDEEVDAMLKSEVIRRSKSPFNFPVVIVKKGEDKQEKRFCIDFRQLNDVTVKDKYPLPRMEDVFDSLHGAKYFSNLDLLKGFWQIPIAENDKNKTAFSTRKGHFEFNRMPFGLTNAPQHSNVQ